MRCIFYISLTAFFIRGTNATNRHRIADGSSPSRSTGISHSANKYHNKQTSRLLLQLVSCNDKIVWYRLLGMNPDDVFSIIREQKNIMASQILVAWSCTKDTVHPIPAFAENCQYCIWSSHTVCLGSFALRFYYFSFVFFCRNKIYF